MYQRLCQLDSLLHSRRERLHVPVSRLAQSHIVESFVRSLRRVIFRDSAQFPEIRQESNRAHVGNQAVVLGKVSYELPNRQPLAENASP